MMHAFAAAFCSAFTFECFSSVPEACPASTRVVNLQLLAEEVPIPPLLSLNADALCPVLHLRSPSAAAGLGEGTISSREMEAQVLSRRLLGASLVPCAAVAHECS